jgi:hypothetical protein
MRTIDIMINDALNTLYNLEFFKGQDSVIDALVAAGEIIEFIIGPYLNEKQLQKLLESVSITKSSTHPDDPVTIWPYSFCPRCGCAWERSTGNTASHPEVYERWFCIRCGFLVAMADNGPPRHALEWKDKNYRIEKE